MKRFLFFILLSAVPIYGKIVLDDVMTKKQKEETGVAQLNDRQKMALQEWINDHFIADEEKLHRNKEPLSLSLNIGEGSRLELSDGSTYEIDPEDRIYTSFWITPIPLMVGESKNPQYPVKITNMNTGTSVNGKRVSRQELLEESERMEKQLPRQNPPEKLPRKHPPEKKPTPSKPK